MLSASRQSSSVYQSTGSSKLLNSYEFQDYGFGAQADYQVTQRWQLFYNIQASMGHGQRESTDSTPSSALSMTSGSLQSRGWRHALGVAVPVNRLLSLSVAWQQQVQNLSWNNDANQMLLQEVDSNLQLSLNNQPLLLREGQWATSSSQRSQSIQLGLVLRFGPLW